MLDPGWISRLEKGDYKTLGRLLSLIENEHESTFEILTKIKINKTASVIGITGPSGAGKSTLLNSIIDQLLNADQRVALIAIDPSSPFNFGALLGDRIRLSKHFTNPNLYIRSVASRGSLGGLSDKIIEMVDLLKASNFDHIFIETVGVGQSEVEIAGLADRTIVLLVPESGDEVQIMKAGLMEIADAFVINKSDRPDSDLFYNRLQKILRASHTHHDTPVFRSIATEAIGTEKIVAWLEDSGSTSLNTKRIHLLAEKALRIIKKERTKEIDILKLRADIESAMNENEAFNIYKYVYDSF